MSTPCHTIRVILAVSVLICILTGCTNPCKQLNNIISEALTDNRITDAEAKGFLEFIKDPDNNFRKNCSNLRTASGQPDQAALLNIIKENKIYRKLQKEGHTPILEGLTVKTDDPLKAKLYLEASRSMFPYDNPYGQGKFKLALDRLLSPFETAQPGQTKLAIVNDKVYDLPLSYNDFIGKPNLYEHKTLPGDSSFTDFNLIFRQILAHIKEGEIAVLASDLIYSPINREASSTRVMDMGAELMTNLFGPAANTTSLLIIQMSADYKGKYYSETARRWVNGPEKRPYYLCLMARNATMQRFLAESSRHDIEYLPGFRNFWLFTQANEQAAPTYTILFNDSSQRRMYRKHSDEVTDKDKTIHSLEKVKVDPVTKTLTIPLAVDLSKFHLPDTIKTNPAQYEVTGPDNFQITAIKANTVPGEFNTTHQFILTTNKPVNRERTMTISMRRTFPPSWVRESHSDDDSQPDTRKTFGLQNLLQGIERAYNSNNQQVYFTLTVSLTP